MKAATPQQVVDGLARSMDLMFTEGRKAMEEATALTAARVSELAPKRTGRLAGNIAADVRVTQTGISGTVRPRERYAGLVDRGTGLYVEFHHRITPKADRRGGSGRPAALRLGGGTVFRRSVKGQRPQRFMERAKQSVQVEVEARLRDGAGRATIKAFK